MQNKKIWAVLMHLSYNAWLPKKQYNIFDDQYWDEFLMKCKETSTNMIVLDVGDGVEYKSHPEICVKDAWSRERVHSELEKCRNLGIELIPKLNFSTSHCYWMGEYRKMTSSKPYYDFCRDIINEIYEIFEAPRFIHIGMDEEEIINTRVSDYVVFRQGDLLIHDIKFLVDEVNKTGATPWIWHDPVTEYMDKFTDVIGPDEVIISPWWYWGYTRDKLFPILTDYEGLYANRGIKYEHDVPCRVNFLKNILPLMEKGYRYIPTPSTFYKVDGNTEETVEFFKNGSPSDDQILGFMTAPWKKTLPKNKADLNESLELLKEAREKYYGE